MQDKTTTLQKEIGQRIMLCRGENESQQQLGEAIGVSREIIQHWERGSRQIKAEHICKLAKHFGTSPDYLLGFTSALSSDAKERATEEHTGLSLDAIKRLREALLTLKALGGESIIPNWFFSSGFFLNLVVAAEKYRISSKESDGEPNYITLESGQQDIKNIIRQAAKLEMMEVVLDMTKEIDNIAKG